jgi:hypothetical protein
MEPFEETLMKKHRFTEFRDLRERITLSQDPPSQLFRRAWLDAFREAEKRIDIERHLVIFPLARADPRCRESNRSCER